MMTKKIVKEIYDDSEDDIRRNLRKIEEKNEYITKKDDSCNHVAHVSLGFLSFHAFWPT